MPRLLNLCMPNVAYPILALEVEENILRFHTSLHSRGAHCLLPLFQRYKEERKNVDTALFLMRAILP